VPLGGRARARRARSAVGCGLSGTCLESAALSIVKVSKGSLHLALRAASPASLG
jgi:hypothetical protein